MFRTLNVTLALAALALIPLAGCGEKLIDPVETPLVKPKTGSLYIYNQTRYDTNGLVRSSFLDSIKVIATGVTVGGFTDAQAMVNSADPDTAHAHYETNGDFTFITPADTNHDGINDVLMPTIYPYASHGKKERRVDTLRNSGTTYSILRDSLNYAGDQSITVPAGTFSVSKVVELNDIRSYNADGVQYDRVREISTFYFAPKLGFLAKWTFEHEYIDTTGKLTRRILFSQNELKSYSMP